MSAAVITLSDEGGNVSAEFKFEGGFNKDSHAHQHALLFKKWMDENMKPIEQAEGAEGVN